MYMYGCNHVYVWSRGNMNAINNPHGDHECVEARGEGITQEKVPKFSILEGKSS